MSLPLRIAWWVLGCAWLVDLSLWALRAYNHTFFVHVMQAYFWWLPS